MLSSNALEVLNKRYFIKNEKGEIIENWEGLCKRVSKHIAQDEKEEVRQEWEDKYFNLLYNLKFLPNSPTLMNAGKENGMLSACISGESYVCTIGGLKKMKDISIGDLVLTHKGRFRKVVNKTNNGFKNVIGIYKGINTRRKNCNLYVTPEHKILQKNNKWNRADSIKDTLDPFLETKDKFIENIDFSNIELTNNRKIEKNDGKIYLLNTHKKSKDNYSKRTLPLTNNLKNDIDLAWFFGMFISEGNIGYRKGNVNSVRFTLHKKETEYIDKIKEISSKFGITAHVNESSVGDWVAVNLHHFIFANYILNLFGTGCDKKRIPYWIFNGNTEYIKSFLKGIFDGDGHVMWNGNVQLTLANPSIIYQVLLLLRKIGVNSFLTLDISNNLTKKPTALLKTYSNSVYKEDNIHIYRNIETEKKEVFDISVEEDNSFIAGDFICHNCFSLDIPDSLSGIMDTAKDMALIHKGGGGTGFNLGKLRPKNSMVKSTSGVASGPISFMKMLNDICEQVKQGGCFIGDTLIGTPSGPIKIKDIKSNQIVYSYDIDKMSVVLSRTTGSWETKKQAEIWKLTTDKGLTIYATPDHPILCKTKIKKTENKKNWMSGVKFIKLKDLNLGQKIMPLNVCKLKKDVEQGNHRIINVEFSHYEDTYNIEVPETHTFAVVNQENKGIFVSNSRRGANIGLLPCHHPDILEFITCKQDTTQITNFNISILITDVFMNAVIKDEEYDIINPHTGNVEKRLKAKVVFDKIVDNAWNTGEPGLFFIDTVNRTYEYPEEPLDSCNPCLAKGSYVNTPKGLKKVEDIKEGDFVSTVLGSEPVEKIEIHKDYPIYKVCFTDGGEQFVTENHVYHGIDKKKKIVKKALKDFKIGDFVRLFPSHLEDIEITEKEELAWQFKGILLGDGCYTNKQIDKSNMIELATNKDETDYNNKLKEIITTLGYQYSKDSISKESKGMSIIIKNGTQVLKDLNLKKLYSYEKFIDIENINSKSTAIAILDGLLATDGNVNLFARYPQIRWMTSSKQLAHDIRNLCFMCGMQANLSSSLHKGGVINGREIKSNYPGYVITISGQAMKYYIENSKCINPSKMEKMKEAIINHLLTGNTWKTRIRSIEPYGKSDVYDLYCSKSDTWITSGYVQVGCGEVAAAPYNSCNLGSINLNKYYSSKFNWKELEEDVRMVTRFLDSVISVNKYPLEKIRIETLKTRKVGLGIMGLGDLFYKMKIRYGSEESFKLAEKLMKFIQDISVNESEKLGREKGECPVFKGRRNLWTTIIAPTGTLSIIVDASSGCEPIFSLAYIRNCMDNTKMEVINPIFKESLEGNKIELTEDLRQKLFSSKSIKDIKEIPDELKEVFVTAFDVTPEEHVKMQASLQKYVHGGISKSINMLKSATKEDVKNAYLLAYKLNCKGITIYRDGSRPNQVLSSVVKEEPKIRYRSKIAKGTTEKFETPLGNMYLTINKNKEEDEEPIEVMMTIGKSGGITLSFLEAMGRLISTGLKYRIPLVKLAKCLKGIKTTDSLFDGSKKMRYDSIPDLIGKELERISIEKVKEEKFFNECPNCGGELRKEEGCTKCVCGYSKC